MQYLPTRGETGECERRAGATMTRTMAVVVLGGVLLAGTGCSKSVSATVAGDELTFNEREQEALVRYEHCGARVRGANEMARCTVIAMDEAHMDVEEDSSAWLDKMSKYARGRASGLLGMEDVEDGELRARLLEICNRVYASESAWCASTYARTP